MASKAERGADAVHEAVAQSPLTGLTAAAGIMGMAPPNFSRWRKSNGLPRAVPVEGSADVFVKAEVEAAARERSRRAARGE